MIITLQLSTQKSFGSWIIRYGTNSSMSHVDLVLPDGRLLGARMDGGVQIRPYNYGNFSAVQHFQADVPDEVGNKIYEFCKAQCGKPYDKTGIFNFFIQDRNWRSTNAWFCSEIVTAAFEYANWPLLNPEVPVSRITPRDLTLSLRLKMKK